MINKIQHVVELKNQLLAMGYLPFQLDTIIRETIDTTQLDKLTTVEMDQVTEVLEEYVRFAQKCRTANKGKRK
jgi:hypothetical protein